LPTELTHQRRWIFSRSRRDDNLPTALLPRTQILRLRMRSPDPAWAMVVVRLKRRKREGTSAQRVGCRCAQRSTLGMWGGSRRGQGWSATGCRHYKLPTQALRTVDDPLRRVKSQYRSKDYLNGQAPPWAMILGPHKALRGRMAEADDLILQLYVCCTDLF
jgi:hypothetical protein